jgi:hypothetical protein
MNAQEFTQLLVHTIPARLPVGVSGAPGIGKTAVISQVAKLLNHRLITIHLATLDPVDLGGYPLTTGSHKARRIERVFDDLLASVFAATEPTILLIDEFGQADTACQKAAAPFFSLERRVNNRELPGCLTVCMATNTTEHRSGAMPILNHVRSRLAAFPRLEASLDAFFARATIDDIHPHILSFLKSYPTMLYELEMLGAKQRQERGLSYEKIYTSGEGYTCPRTWYRVDQLLRAQIPRDIEVETFTSVVGEPAAVQFAAHNLHARQALDLDGIVNHGQNFTFPAASDFGLRWAFAFGVASLATPKNVGRVFDIAEQLHSHRETEYATVICQQTVARNPQLITSPEFFLLAGSDLGKLIRTTPQAARKEKKS